MYPIKAKFIRFHEVSLYECIGTTGVYVIWDDTAQHIPTYIGQGNVIARLKDHHSAFKPPLDGYIALLGQAGNRNSEHDAEELEGMLLWVAEETNRLSKENRQRSRLAKTRRLLKKTRLVRAKLEGYDLFSPPRFPRDLSQEKRFIRVFEEAGELRIEHYWRQLRGSS